MSRGRQVLAGVAAGLLTLLSADPGHAQVRARELGIPFDGQPGPLNAITDVTGVEVGHATLIRGEGALAVGQGPVRTGVTAVLPRGRGSMAPVFAGWFSLNGNGEMTGTAWVDESGELTGPIMITNTHSVGVVRDAVIDWVLAQGAEEAWLLPVVAETWDGVLNDLNGFHVRPEHAAAALDEARSGAVQEGAVGGGTGMICNGFKGGIGTASRRLSAEAGGYTVGVLVQCNYGRQDELLVAGIPVGRELAAAGVTGRCRAGDDPPSRAWVLDLPSCGGDEAPGLLEAGRPTRGSERTDAVVRAGSAPTLAGEELGSIIILVATDAPLLPHQLERLVKRAALGLGRVGSVAHNGSGDLFLAFSTAAALGAGAGVVPLEMLPNERLNPLFTATVQATEEAIVNTMVVAETMTGADGVRVQRLPHDEVRSILERHGRLRSGN